jgi:hypothetical protein
METIYKILGIAILAIFFAYWFTPIQRSKEKILSLLPQGFITNHISTLLNCSRCLAFWVYLAIYHNAYQAAIASVLAYFITHLITKTEAWYE